MVRDVPERTIDIIVKYWLLIISALGMVATIAIAGDNIQTNAKTLEIQRQQLKEHEMRLDKLEQIGRDIKNLSSNQNRILNILLKQANEE